MFADTTLWVFIALVAFVIIIVWAKVPKLVAGKLDKRADKIRQDLEEAEYLRKEAEALLTRYQTNLKDAEKHAKTIVDNAKVEADRLKAAAQKQLEEDLKRRSDQAKQKIERAEAAAVAEIQATAADLAHAAAANVFENRLTGADADGLIEKAINQIPEKFSEKA